MDFKTLKKNSADLDRLAEKINQLNTGNVSFDDDNEGFWQPEVDKSGNGYAVIRFLPEPPEDGDEGSPFVRYYKHGFKGPTGAWYIENSLTTLGQRDPVGEYNSYLWNNGNQEQARKQKRKLYYVSNILVIKDSANPENEGKVFYFRYGKQIFDIIEEAMHPQFEDEEGFNPFDLWTGADFKLKITQDDGFRSYKKSEFVKPAPIGTSDSDRERIWKEEKSLAKFIAEDRFKSYNELRTKLESVMGIKLADVLSDNTSVSPKTNVKFDEPVEDVVATVEDAEPVSEDSDDDVDKDIEFFKDLAD